MDVETDEIFIDLEAPSKIQNILTPIFEGA